MKQPVSLRRQPIRRTIVYSIMTLSVAVLVTITMLFVLGYSFNEADGKIEQGGLLQFRSIPDGATITLNEVKIGSRTPTKSTVMTGNYSASFNIDGYRTWEKSIFVHAGQVAWLSYARMIPMTLTPQTVRTFSTIAGVSTSPGRNYILVNQKAGEPTFELADISSDNVKYKTLVLPSDSYTVPASGKSQKFIMDSWSGNENAVLLKHVYEKKVEWILFDRDDPEKSLNITKTFAINPEHLEFAAGSDQSLFAQTGDGVVRRIDLNEMTLSRPLATAVDTFTGYDDKTIVYTTLPDKKGVRSVGYASTDIREPQIIHAYLDKKKSLYAVMTTYLNKRYVAIVYGDKLTIETGSLPTPDNPSKLKLFASKDLPSGARELEIAPNNRFIITRLASGFATYDLELNKFDEIKWAYKQKKPEKIQWLDGYIVWSDNGGHLRIYDFDGANQQNIMSVSEDYAALLSPSGKYVYGILKTKDGLELRRVQLIL